MTTTKSIADAAKNLYGKIVKNFTLQDLIKHRNLRYKNLYEMISQYPTGGRDFKIWRKSWPEDSYWIIKDITYKDFRHGRSFGIFYWKGKQENEIPIRIRNGLKRGTWQYDINGASASLDNGVEYSTEEMIFYNEKRQKEYFEKFPQLKPNYIIPEGFFITEAAVEKVDKSAKKDEKKKK